jgi:hypothetical protein
MSTDVSEVHAASIITAIMMEAAHTSVDILLRIRQYIPEDSELHTRRRENLKLSVYQSACNAARRRPDIAETPFVPRSANAGLVMDKVVLGRFWDTFVSEISFSPVNIIPLWLSMLIYSL